MKCAKEIFFILKRFFLLIKSGFSILSISSQGKYSERTDAINDIRHEMLNENFGTFRTDKKNLIRDRKAISGDIYRTFSNLIAG